jgi:hypothetical protein
MSVGEMSWHHVINWKVQNDKREILVSVCTGDPIGQFLIRLATFGS